MANKVMINGKELTERSVSSIEINGQKIAGNVIHPENIKPGEMISAKITVKPKSETVEPQAFQAQAIENVELQKDNNKINQTENNKKESLVSKALLYIKVFFKSFLEK